MIRISYVKYRLFQNIDILVSRTCIETLTIPLNF